MTTLPRPERPRTPAPTGLSDLSLDDRPELIVAPEVSITPDLSLAGVSSLPTQTDERAERASSDAALLEGVTRVAAAVEVLVGLWLALSPWLVGSNGSSALRVSNIVVGILLVGLGALRLSRPATPRGPAISFGLGAWTIVAAFVLSFQNGATGTAPLWSAIACGAVLTGAAAWATTEAERSGLRAH